MNVTVGVALITAGSTLAGGLLASLTSLRLHRQQLNAQDKIAISDRLEREYNYHRGLRRDAYVQFLSRFDEVLTSLEECWIEIPPATGDEEGSETIGQTLKMFYLLDTCLNTIQLEGPQTVTVAAHELRGAALAEFDQLQTCARQNYGRTNPLFQLANDAHVDGRGNRFNAKEKFIKVAQEALE